MTDRPVIFSAPMVRALLDGRKSQTRRLRNVRWKAGQRESVWMRAQPGDRLWVREGWRIPGDTSFELESDSRCTGPEDLQFMASASEDERAAYHWRPSIHMPRWASRLTLTVTEVRRQRLQEISDDDALAEGIRRWEVERGTEPAFVYFDSLTKGNGWPSSAEAFRQLWQSLHGAGAWDANPEVVALTFTIDKRNIDATEARAA